MVKVRSQFNMGPDYKPSEFKPSATEYKPQPFKPSKQSDPIRHTEFKPSTSTFKPSNEPYVYKPYKPSHVGIYGEKEKPRAKRVVKEPEPKKTKPPKKPRRTFESYSLPSGPDIRTYKMGPDYEVKPYKQSTYKPGTPFKPSKRTTEDPLKYHESYATRKLEVYKGNVEYKLTKENNAGMRHWQYGFVEDTVAATRPTEQKYAAKEKPKVVKKEEPKVAKKAPEKAKPAEKKELEKPKVVAAVVPVHARNEPKKFTSSSTQHFVPDMKTIPTQTQSASTKTFGTQYVPTQTKSFGTGTEQTKTSSTAMQTNTPSPLPKIVPIVAPVTESSRKKVSTKTMAVQCSESPKTTTVRGTQYEGQTTQVSQTQTSPIIFHKPQTVAFAHTAKSRTPDYAYTETRRNSPEATYREPPRRSPSPKVVALVAATSNRRSLTPTKKRSPTPQLTRKAKTPTPSPPIPRSKTPVRPVSEARWTPSPEVLAFVPVVATARSTPPRHYTPTPKQEVPKAQVPKAAASPKHQPVTESYSQPEVYAASSRAPPPPSPVKSSAAPPAPSPARSAGPFFPPIQTRRELPPEIGACIEAYDSVHGSNGSALPTIQRGMKLG